MTRGSATAERESVPARREAPDGQRSTANRGAAAPQRRARLGVIRRIASIFVIVLLAGARVRGEDGGLPMLRVIPQSEHHGGPQTFDIAQDRRGVLHFGNLKGVLTYDGAWWSAIELPNHSAVFAVESDDAGVVAAGGVNEFGFLAASRYRSLVAQLPAAQHDVGEVRGLCTSGRGFVFASERYLIEWNGGAPRVLAEVPGPTQCRRIGGAVVLWNRDGLHRIEGGHVFGAGLQGKAVDAAVETNGGNTLAAVRGEGLYVVDRAGNATRIDNDASARVAHATVTDAVRLRDGGFALTTHEGSVLLLDARHALREILDHDAGLPDMVIASAFVDAEGALWLATEGPLVRADLAAPLTVLDARRGVSGMPNGVLPDREKLWIPTSRGLFVLDAHRAPGSNAHRVDGVPAPAWWAIAVDDGVLAATSSGVFHLRDGAPPARIDDETTYELRRSKRDPSRVWAATRKGVTRLRLDGGQWHVDGTIARAPQYPRDLVEFGEELWSGSVFNGVFRVDAQGAVTRFGDGEMSVTMIDKRLVAIRDGRFLHIDAQQGLVPDPTFGSVTVPGGFLVAAEDGNGDVWVGADPVRVVNRRTMEALPLPGISGAVNTISRDASGAMWIAMQSGLYRGGPSSRVAAPPAPLIHPRTTDATPLPHDFRRLRIEFAPVTYAEGVRYQYRLEPVDRLWSDWTSEPFIDYTRLGGGQYTFHLRTRNASGALSDEATWTFTVLPPWYRKPLAITLFVILAAALIALIVKLRTRALRRQADRLRALIAERTQELSEANQHLERLALLDDLTGIPNRRYFDRALARAWETARDRRGSLSVILLDLDHFKNLNDEHGHAAGDESLVHLGRLLAQKIRRSGEFSSRSGDVVARIGGEEFAILLGTTDAEGALRTAETLRASIADMEIFFDTNPIRLSVSCGVATVTPGETDSADVLVRRADAALYAAKAAGRNCVRSAA